LVVEQKERGVVDIHESLAAATGKNMCHESAPSN